MSFPFAALDLLAKYIRHDVPIYCHDHPTQPDGMNACVKEIESQLKAFELPDSGGIPSEINNPVTIGTMQIRDNDGILEASNDGEVWAEMTMLGNGFDLRGIQFIPPTVIGGATPPDMYDGNFMIWIDATGGVWLLYKQNETVKSIELTTHGT